jgi:hypothetical protein
MDGTYELEMSGLPRLYILPAKKKFMPFTDYHGDATASAFIQFITKFAHNDLKISNKKVLSTLSHLGTTESDDVKFYDKLAKEGFHITNKTRSFTNGGFKLQDNSEKIIPSKKEEKVEAPVENKPKVDGPKVEDFEEL